MDSSRFYIYKQKPIGMEENVPFMVSKYELKLLGINLKRYALHTEETRSERDTCTPMFIAALFIIARTWKQPRCPSAD